MNTLATAACWAVIVWLGWLALRPDQPQPHNLPTPADVRQYLLDCEQFNPGRQCIVVAMPVPDFSEEVKGEPQ